MPAAISTYASHVPTAPGDSAVVEWQHRRDHAEWPVRQRAIRTRTITEGRRKDINCIYSKQGELQRTNPDGARLYPLIGRPSENRGKPARKNTKTPKIIYEKYINADVTANLAIAAYAPLIPPIQISVKPNIEALAGPADPDRHVVSPKCHAIGLDPFCPAGLVGGVHR